MLYHWASGTHWCIIGVYACQLAQLKTQWNRLTSCFFLLCWHVCVKSIWLDLIQHSAAWVIKIFGPRREKVQSHILLFIKISWAKSSHFNRNSCKLEFCVRGRDFTVGLSWSHTFTTLKLLGLKLCTVDNGPFLPQNLTNFTNVIT